eukprot:6243357-Amphidinium_carterae.1
MGSLVRIGMVLKHARRRAVCVIGARELTVIAIAWPELGTIVAQPNRDRQGKVWQVSRNTNIRTPQKHPKK